MAQKVTPKATLMNPLVQNNPITIQVLGICSALAVTVQVKNGIVMSLAVIFVLSMSNLVISLIRNWIPGKIRFIVELAVIASLVIFIDQMLKAYSYQMSKQLSVFVGLIITNCIVMGRAEAFAMGNKPVISMIDGLGNGLGYGYILVLVSAAREVLGSGTFLGYQVVPQSIYGANGGWYENMGIMVLAPGAFILLSLLVWTINAIVLRGTK
jgi:Na+-transporting NADH:ubiquinone oxidoreductase subunit D